MLPNAWKAGKNVLQTFVLSIFRHADKVNCLMPVSAAIYCLKCFQWSETVVKIMDLVDPGLLQWYCCDWKSRAAYAQSFAQWQQATIEFTCHDHSIIPCSRHIYVWCCSSCTSRSWWITQSTQHHRRGCNNIPPFYNEPHWSHILCVKAELRTTFTSWSQHHFVAIGIPERHMRKASHCGSKEQ